MDHRSEIRKANRLDGKSADLLMAALSKRILRVQTSLQLSRKVRIGRVASINERSRWDHCFGQGRPW